MVTLRMNRFKCTDHSCCTLTKVATCVGGHLSPIRPVASVPISILKVLSTTLNRLRSSPRWC